MWEASRTWDVVGKAASFNFNPLLAWTPQGGFKAGGDESHFFAFGRILKPSHSEDYEDFSAVAEVLRSKRVAVGSLREELSSDVPHQFVAPGKAMKGKSVVSHSHLSHASGHRFSLWL